MVRGGGARRAGVGYSAVGLFPYETVVSQQVYGIKMLNIINGYRDLVGFTDSTTA